MMERAFEAAISHPDNQGPTRRFAIEVARMTLEKAGVVSPQEEGGDGFSGYAEGKASTELIARVQFKLFFGLAEVFKLHRSTLSPNAAKAIRDIIPLLTEDFRIANLRIPKKEVLRMEFLTGIKLDEDSIATLDPYKANYNRRISSMLFLACPGKKKEEVTLGDLMKSGFLDPNNRRKYLHLSHESLGFLRSAFMPLPQNQS